MISQNYGFVQVEVSPASRDHLQTIVSKLVPADLLYKSPEISYIAGNVADKAHLTVCYGIENSDLVKRSQSTGPKIKVPKSSTIVDVNFVVGYQDLYYSIFITPMVNEDIYRLNNWIRKNNLVAPISGALNRILRFAI